MHLSPMELHMQIPGDYLPLPIKYPISMNIDHFILKDNKQEKYKM